jgi:DNA repair exonuclease SbcCD ATPase subunit
MDLTELRREIERKKGKKQELERNIEIMQNKVIESEQYLINLEKARSIINLVGMETQQQLQFHISDIASLALESIFKEAYKLKLEFVERRNKSECDIMFERNEDTFDPLDASGGGPVDVASFALRIASWSMALKRTRNVIILDEPMRFLSTEYRENASEMIKEVSKKLGIQFIIITHDPILTTYADKTFTTEIRKGITKIK